MSDSLPTTETDTRTGPGFGTLETVFEALGRVLVVLDRGFRVIRASHTLDDLAFPGAAAGAMGRPIEELVGARLFGPSDTLRESLEQGLREEGRRAILRCGEGSARLVSLTAAVLPTDVTSHCDPRARYIVVLRPAETDNGLVQSMLSSHGLVARSPVMLRIVHLVESLQRSEATVLVTGESGTGKELAARAVHFAHARREEPFIAVNCGAFPQDLMESELFGHVRGAFTGADRDKVGLIEEAGAGTLFLDEVGDLPLPLQVKLNRALQEREFRRVGDTRTRRVAARILAATNVDLEAKVAEGSFREDLFYRLNVFPIRLPPLRERAEDVPLLAAHLLSLARERSERGARGFAPDAVRALTSYGWPGNVRELQNAIERAAAVAEGPEISAADLPADLIEPQGRASTAVDGLVRLPYQEAISLLHDRATREYLASLMRSTGGNVSKAAEQAELARESLHRLLRRHGVDPDDYRR